jgi:hypothetical protein
MRLLLFCWVFFLLLSCSKTTHFNGKVFSSDGNTPLSGVEVILRSLKDKKGGGAELAQEDRMTTNSSGTYDLSVNGKGGAYYAWISVKKNGYVTTQSERLGIGECGEIDFILHPYDAYLSLTFENQSEVTRNFFYEITSPVFIGESTKAGPEGGGPFPTLPHQGHTHLIPVPGNTDIQINWNTTNFIDNDPAKKPKVFCPRHDTTHLLIKF